MWQMGFSKTCCHPHEGPWKLGSTLAMVGSSCSAAGACRLLWSDPKTSFVSPGAGRLGLMSGQGYAWALGFRSLPLPSATQLGKLPGERFIVISLFRGEVTLVGQGKSDFSETSDLADELETCLQCKGCCSLSSTVHSKGPCLQTRFSSMLPYAHIPSDDRVL